MLVADALRLGGAVLGLYPNMLAPQLVGRLLPEIGSNPNVKMLLNACDKAGCTHCALSPVYHCLHTPGGPLKVIHQILAFLQSIYKYFLVFPRRSSICRIWILPNNRLTLRCINFKSIHYLGFINK